MAISTAPDVLPWYKSKIIVAGLVSLISKLLVVSGLITELSPEDSEVLSNTLVLLFSGAADIVTIVARAKQKSAPVIVAGSGDATVVRALLPVLLLLPVLPLLSACGAVGAVGLAASAPAPAVLADRTKIDETAGQLITTAYTGFARLAAFAIQSGAIRDPATIRRIGELDNAAYAAVLGVRRAYEAGNSRSYGEALAKAKEALAAFLDATKGLSR